MVDPITSTTPPPPPPPSTFPMNIAVIGATNVGKSLLVNTLNDWSSRQINSQQNTSSTPHIHVSDVDDFSTNYQQQQQFNPELSSNSTPIPSLLTNFPTTTIPYRPKSFSSKPDLNTNTVLPPYTIRLFEIPDDLSLVPSLSSSIPSSQSSVSTTTTSTTDLSSDTSVSKERTKWSTLLANIDAVILMYDVASRMSFLNIPELLDIVSDLSLPTILVGTKLDLIVTATSASNTPAFSKPIKPLRRQVEERVGKKLSGLFGALFMEVGLPATTIPTPQPTSTTPAIGGLIGDPTASINVPPGLPNPLINFFQKTINEVIQKRQIEIYQAHQRYIEQQQQRHHRRNHSADLTGLKEQLRKHLSPPSGASTSALHVNTNANVHANKQHTRSRSLTNLDIAEVTGDGDGGVVYPIANIGNVKNAEEEDEECDEKDEDEEDDDEEEEEDEDEEETAIPQDPSTQEKSSPKSSPTKDTTSSDPINSTTNRVSTVSDTSFASSGGSSGGQGKSSPSGYTIDELIERLSSPDTHDIEFTKVFLMLYRRFMTPLELLDKLIDRFDAFDEFGVVHWLQQIDGGGEGEDSPSQSGTDGIPMNRSIHPVQLRVCNTLIYWLTDYLCDFVHPKTRFTLQIFLEILSHRPEFTLIVQKIAALILRDLPGLKEVYRHDWTIPAHSNTSSSSSSSSSSLLEADKNETEDEDEQIEEWILNNYNILGINKPHDTHEENEPEHEPSLLAYRPRKQSPSTAPVSVSMETKSLSTSSLGMSALFGSSLPPEDQEFLDLDNRVIAEQLCLLEFEIFEKIKPRDFLHHIWSRTQKGRHAPSVSASIAHFNLISSWVTSRILSQKKLKTRAKFLSKMMKIASCLRTLNNFNTLMAFLAGINAAPVSRLRKTRRIVSTRKCFAEYIELETLMSSEKSFARYRTALKRSQPPSIPYLGVFLRDLLYIDEANKDRRPEHASFINVSKFLLIGDIIMLIKSFQVRPYAVVKDERVLSVMANMEFLGEEEAYRRSLELEPRAESSASASFRK